MKRISWRELFQKYLRVLKLMRPYWLILAGVMLTGLVVQALGMLVPYFSQLLIDWAYPNHNIGLMEVLVVAVVGVNVATVVTRNTRSYFSLWLSAKLNNIVGLLFFNHIQHLPVRFFDQRRTGEIVSRFQDINTSLNAVMNSFQTILMNGAYIVFVPPVLFYINWKLALLALCTLPFTTYVTYRLGHTSRPYLKKTAEAYAELRGVQIEIIDNIKTLKTMALEGANYNKTDSLMQDAMKLQFKAARIGGYYGTMTGLLRAVSTSLYIWFGWHMIFSGELSLGMFLAFTAYVGYLYNPISELVALISDLQQSSVSFDRMFEYLDKRPEQDPALVKSPAGPIEFRINGDIEFQNVAFSYIPKSPVLRNINLTIKQGTINAIIGPSGSGKTSLLRLLLALDTPDSGNILVDGTEISKLPLPDLRRQISVVWQESGLVKGTLFDNLTLGSESPSPEWVRDVVRLCCLEELVESLPDGYETEIAEKGATISAGQRQRVAIARALIRRTPILVLDEATANIDIKTETEILQNIFSEFCDTTILFVSHRLASAALADKIFIVDSGYIVESGTEAELQASNGIYSSLCYQHSTLPPKESAKEFALSGD